MRLGGWTRLLVVISGAWLLVILGSAYLTHPPRAPAPSAFWVYPTNPFDRFDQPPTAKGQEPSDAEVVGSAASAGGKSTGLFDDLPLPVFNWWGFVTYGLGPVVLLWATYFSMRWVAKGFKPEA